MPVSTVAVAVDTGAVETALEPLPETNSETLLSINDGSVDAITVVPCADDTFTGAVVVTFVAVAEETAFGVSTSSVLISWVFSLLATAVLTTGFATGLLADADLISLNDGIDKR